MFLYITIILVTLNNEKVRISPTSINDNYDEMYSYALLVKNLFNGYCKNVFLEVYESDFDTTSFIEVL